jgi:hypothetical protein
LADGNEQRYGRRFLGLSHLEEADEDIELIARSEGGDAAELVVPKDALAVFSDSRWTARPCDEKELSDALRGPPLLFEVEGLDAIRWHEYTHAYGIATELPKDIQRLASSELEVREQALWDLSGSIYHQGTIYPATAVALPFLLRLACDPRTPDPIEIWELLEVIAESSAVDPMKIRETWAWRRKNFGEVFAKPSEEMAGDEVDTIANVRNAFLANIERIRQAANGPEVRKNLPSILEYLESGPKST